MRARTHLRWQRRNRMPCDAARGFALQLPERGSMARDRCCLRHLAQRPTTGGKPERAQLTRRAQRIHGPACVAAEVTGLAERVFSPDAPAHMLPGDSDEIRRDAHEVAAAQRSERTDLHDSID